MRPKTIISPIICCFLYTQMNAQSNKINLENFIKEASMEVEVADYYKSKNQLNVILKKIDGYIYTENESKFTTRLVSQMTVRIPNIYFGKFVEELTKEAKLIGSKNVKVVDVAKQLKDLKERLTLKNEVKTKFLGLLKEAKTAKMINHAEEKIEGVNSEIEQLDTKIKLLQETGYSTININFFQKLKVYVPPVPDEGFNLSKRSLIRYGTKASYVIIPLIILALVIYFLYQRHKRSKKYKRKKRRSSSSSGLLKLDNDK